jgi:hypothetical protein
VLYFQTMFEYLRFFNTQPFLLTCWTTSLSKTSDVRTWYFGNFGYVTQRQKRVISEQSTLYAWPCNPAPSAWRRQVVRYPHPPHAVSDVCIMNRWTRPVWRHREQSSVSTPEHCRNNCVAYIQTWLSLRWFIFCTQLSSVSSFAWRSCLYSSRLGISPPCSSAVDCLVHVASYEWNIVPSFEFWTSSHLFLPFYSNRVRYYLL